MSLFANDVAFIAIFSLRLKAKEKQPIYMQYAVNWKCRKEYLGGETIETIYWGGGTPSQLDKEDFETIFYYLHKNYSISSHPEITLEANPDDLTPDYIAMLRTLPFNRLSMGIQTFNESILKVLHAVTPPGKPRSFPELPCRRVSEYQH